MLVEASLWAVCRINAAAQNPASAAQEIRHLLKGVPGERCPCLLLAEQQDQGIGGVTSDGELPAPRRSRELISRGDCPANGLLDRPSHVAIMTEPQPNVDAPSSRQAPGYDQMAHGQPSLKVSGGSGMGLAWPRRT